ncbi:hypothetical protein IFM89_001934 [Coptis chinensis]|uniref:Serine/threonine specific protein phosphatases domain-containing protein n=1 Tax=Coptis chinensis TaxID=261450 RepID=A0A835LUR5_9MAGN|nr:hypothetical protein IFM89_001934 [Coptis chinensis]
MPAGNVEPAETHPSGLTHLNISKKTRGCFVKPLLKVSSKGIKQLFKFGRNTIKHNVELERLNIKVSAVDNHAGSTASSKADLTNMDQVRNLTRPTDVPDTGLLCDLLLSDPGRDVKGWGMNDRGVYTFGADKVSEFLLKHDLDLVCRAHQVVEDGYDFLADRQLVTIFSAPNYCGEFDNAGAMMNVNESLMCSFQILKPAEKKTKFMVSSKMG